MRKQLQVLFHRKRENENNNHNKKPCKINVVSMELESEPESDQIFLWSWWVKEASRWDSETESGKRLGILRVRKLGILVIEIWERRILKIMGLRKFWALEEFWTYEEFWAQQHWRHFKKRKKVVLKLKLL